MTADTNNHRYWTVQAMERLERDINSQPVSDLVTSMYGTSYYLVEPIGGNWREMEAWAIQTYGPTGSVWEMESMPHRWYMNDRKFWFRNEADRTMFILRWR